MQVLDWIGLDWIERFIACTCFMLRVAHGCIAHGCRLMSRMPGRQGCEFWVRVHRVIDYEVHMVQVLSQDQAQARARRG